MSYTVLRYHVVWATKMRRSLLTPEVEHVLYPMLRNIAYRQGACLIEVNGHEDHIHNVLANPAHMKLSDTIARMKSESAQALRQFFPRLDFRWQRGYGAFTLRAGDYEDVVTYVQDQKIRHARDRLWAPYERIVRPPPPRHPR